MGSVVKWPFGLIFPMCGTWEGVIRISHKILMEGEKWKQIKVKNTKVRDFDHWRCLQKTQNIKGLSEITYFFYQEWHMLPFLQALTWQ